MAGLTGHFLLVRCFVFQVFSALLGFIPGFFAALLGAVPGFLRTFAYFAGGRMAFAFSGVFRFQLLFSARILRLMQFLFGGVGAFMRFSHGFIGSVCGSRKNRSRQHQS